MFHCERCHLPIKIHESLYDLSAAQLDLLVASKTKPDDHLAPVVPADRLQILEEASNAPARSTKNYYDADVDRSFVMLPKQKHSETHTNISARFNTLATVFEVLSATYEIDYPVCSDCVTLLVDTMKARFDSSAREKDTYILFLRKLKDQPGPKLHSNDVLAEMAGLKEQEEALVAELAALEAQKMALELEMTAIEAEFVTLNAEEEAFLVARNKLDAEISDFHCERDRVTTQYRANLAQLDALRATNIYGDVFRISHEGPFGCINGLRLGSLANERVLWNEINAALGQVVLLLATLVRAFDVTTPEYRLRPMGSQSKIEQIGQSERTPAAKKVTVLEAFSSGEYSIERLFTHGKLDAAMVALVDVVRAIWSKIQETDSSMDLPYKMVGEEVGGVSIKLSARTVSEEWTMACKFLLTNVKWLVAYAANKG
ncbi:hypothetical protein BABINDRAFT_166166 [Babjeviella inositovora NRRL Y-12698]|uniref:Uncharacterized protein n=1 Tax=Babjeviella inositovora NRRL Y-12698 TaxID=984486 RepID=A0A1E3QU64_9ASCO|nr:uncharacterized protein BABINDRAFT_166166 [Babjeviella inositovora NRRL Y-12698]ODQ80552.1 hypothetical protein BABINDRAFT_166166 [Babjeviella inositovora NRRL Y-12698]